LIKPFKAQAQMGMGGSAYGHFSGIYGVPSNPAMAAGTHYKWDVNVAGVSGFIGNTYARFPKSTIFHPPAALEDLERGKHYTLDTLSKGKQMGWGNLDIMMPSVLFSIDERKSIAFVWRVRSNANGGNINTDVANFFANGFPNVRYNNMRFDMELANTSFHLWNEYDLTYAQTIKDDGMHLLKGGVTLKILSGIAAGYAQVEDASFYMADTHDANITAGTLKMAYNEGINNWKKPNTSNYKPFGNMGVGLDVGMVYEWREEMDGLQGYDNNDWNPEADDYKMRLGVSVTDIGGISYKKVPGNTDLDLRAQNVDPTQLRMRRGEGWQAYYRRIQQYFTPVASEDKFRMNLPTALNINFDYNFNGRFFLNGNGVFSLNAGRYDASKTYQVSHFQLTPRYDARQFGVYLPISVNGYSQLDMGTGIRIGPLTIGSNTLISNLFQKDKKRMDGFVALRIVPISFGKQLLGCPATQF
jgi:hypothetical protein